MKLIAVYNVFNEAERIGASIEAIHDFVDEIVVFDGAYQTFPYGDSFQSTDGTEKVVSRFSKARWVPAQKPFPNQMEKRSLTLTVGNESDGDYILMVDGDEILLNPEKLPELPYGQFDCGWVRQISDLYSRPVANCRLFRKIEGMHIEGRHHWVFDGDGFLIASHRHHTNKYRQLETGMRLFNFRSGGRNCKREQLKVQFRAKRWAQFEGKYEYENDVYGIEDRASLIPHKELAPTPRDPFIVLKAPDSPRYTMTVPFSREWAIPNWFAMLDRLDLPRESVELLVVVDTNNQGFYRSVLIQLQSRAEQYNGVKLFRTGNSALKEAAGVGARRDRIISLWNLMVPEIQGAIVLGAEDDSLPQPDAYTRLLEIQSETGATFVQGTEVGRWAARMVPHWMYRYDRGELTDVWSAGPANENVVPIHGGGWYCFVCNTDALRRVDFRWEPDTPLGPDHCFVLDLNRMGYKTLGVWDILVDHFGQDFYYRPTNERIDQIHYYKTGGGWRYEIAEQFYHPDYIAEPNLAEVMIAMIPRNNNELAFGEGDVEVEAILTFHSGPEGLVSPRDTLTISSGRARQLIRKGLVVLKPTRSIAPPVRVARPAPGNVAIAIAPQEVQLEIGPSEIQQEPMPEEVKVGLEIPALLSESPAPLNPLECNCGRTFSTPVGLKIHRSRAGH